jgi:proteasome lid subunit RPN8/RPN11
MLYVAPTQMAAMLEHARRDAPNECCGILIGTREADGWRVSEVIPCDNVWEGERHDRFLLDPRAQLRAQRECRGRGLEIVGFYHSHPHSPPVPSQFDADMAWPGHAYVILSLAPGHEGEIRCWEFHEQRHAFDPREIVVG